MGEKGELRLKRRPRPRSGLPSSQQNRKSSIVRSSSLPLPHRRPRVDYRFYLEDELPCPGRRPFVESQVAPLALVLTLGDGPLLRKRRSRQKPKTLSNTGVESELFS